MTGCKRRCDRCGKRCWFVFTRYHEWAPQFDRSEPHRARYTGMGHFHARCAP